jgi:hypothetical protein
MTSSSRSFDSAKANSSMPDAEGVEADPKTKLEKLVQASFFPFTTAKS